MLKSEQCESARFVDEQMECRTILERGGGTVTNFLPRTQLKKLGKADEGQALLLCALALVVLLLATGIATDVGYLTYQKHQMQKAADAGAVGAGIALSIYGSTDGQSQMTAAGQSDSAANGFTNGNNGITVAVNNPPVDGPYSTVSDSQDYVEVTVSQPQPTFFMKIGGFFSVPVAARAVTGLRGASGCIYVLDPTDQDSYLESGGQTQVKTDCGIYVNSSNSKAFEDTGGSCTDSTSIQIVGNQNGWLECDPNQPAPVTGIKSFADPLANRAQPTPACYTSAKGYEACCTTYQTVTISSGSAPNGVYCGGLKLTGTVSMQAGVFYMVGGGFTVSPPATITGTGVTIFNTGTASGSSGYRGISITGGSNVTLSAPTSGATEAILFWEDRNIPWNNVGSSQTSQITGGLTTTSFVGALYFPTTQLVYSGGTSGTAYTNIVAYQLEFTGASTLNDSATTGFGPPAINTAALVQ